MNLLTMDKVSKSFTDKILLKDVTMGINENDKIGVIGINGTGKSTLLKLIAGIELPDQGNIVKGNQVRIEFLPQNPEFDFEKNIIENVMEGQKAKIEHWNLEGEAKAMLLKLGIVDPFARVDTLSGGQKKRVAFVRTLLSPADILVLDEPTNHLDNAMAEWLEEYLNKWKGSFIMVTHDRYFLDKVTNRIIELDQGNIYTYVANYRKFLELKAEREEMEVASERKKKSIYRQDLEWMMRGARARSTKQKAHIQRFEELKNRDKPQETQDVQLNSFSSRLGKKIIKLDNISKAYDHKILIKDFTYIFLKGDRIGIIGQNGAGKTTLLKLINGIAEPDCGSVVIGETVRIGYFSQENEYMDETKKVIDYIREVAEYIQTAQGQATASQMLERFLFNGTMQHSLIQKLSGGEKRRLYLLKVLMEAPNILILDEPTNDLDIQTLSILEDYLIDFDGVVITVSHDRYFLDKVVQRIFSFEAGGEIRQFEGGFSDYKEAQKISDKVGESEKNLESKKVISKPKATKIKFTYLEAKEYEQIDNLIVTLEDRIQLVESEIEKAASNYSELNKWMQEKKELDEEYEKQMERWVYLNDLAEQIKNEKQSR